GPSRRAARRRAHGRRPATRHDGRAPSLERAAATGARRAARAAAHGGGAVRRGRLFARRDRADPRDSRRHGPIGSVPRAAPFAGAARGLEGGGMKDPLPFDHRPDMVLGDALRQALDPGEEGHAAIIARVLAGAEQVSVTSLDATFAAGLAVGAGGRALWVRRTSAAAPERARGLDRMMDDLNVELRLGPGQRDSVRAILQRHRTRMTAVWETVRPRFDSMRAQMDSDVARQLTPEQQARYRDHVTRYRHQKEQEKADTGSGGQQK